MPWKATSVMHAKVQFVADCLGGEPMVVLCERYGISRDRLHGSALCRGRRQRAGALASHIIMARRPLSWWPSW